MENIAIWLQYDGSRYRGWQRQNGTDMTIQGKVEAVLSKMNHTKIEIDGAGRTDAGVHARGQVANFHLDTEKSLKEIQDYCNEFLPKDIRVFQIMRMNPRFHSRLNAKRKLYCYRIRKNDGYDVFTRNYVWQCDVEVSVSRMREAASYLLGKHDFVSFCTKAAKKKSTVRELYSLEIEETETDIVFWLHGSGFLYNMVRIIVGTLFEVGTGKRKPEELSHILQSKDRRKAGETAPAEGLTLWRVDYDEDNGI